MGAYDYKVMFAPTAQVMQFALQTVMVCGSAAK